MPRQAAGICRLPTEILENILVQLVLDHPLGHPAALIPVLCTSQLFNGRFSIRYNSHLYARLFAAMFDFRAGLRRLGPSAVRSTSLSDQFQVCCVALQRIRQGDIYDDALEDTFWRSFFMMSENDGKNRAQLEAAGLFTLVDRYVRNLLTDGKSSTRGWPPESTNNSLALWLMAMTLTPGMFLSLRFRLFSDCL
jgi:hypothetical protein